MLYYPALSYSEIGYVESVYGPQENKKGEIEKIQKQRENTNRGEKIKSNSRKKEIKTDD
jgi:hypothetical protein